MAVPSRAPDKSLSFQIETNTTRRRYGDSAAVHKGHDLLTHHSQESFDEMERTDRVSSVTAVGHGASFRNGQTGQPPGTPTYFLYLKNKLYG